MQPERGIVKPMPRCFAYCRMFHCVVLITLPCTQPEGEPELMKVDRKERSIKFLPIKERRTFHRGDISLKVNFWF